MIAAVVCPHPPLLLRELTGSEDPAAAVRAASVEALSKALATGPELVHVVGSDDPRGPWARDGLSLSLTVGDRLLDLAGWTGRRVRHPVGPADAAGSVAPEEGSVLLVLGDGSARRGADAPGDLDERAAVFDAAIEDALGHGRPEVLAHLDEGLAEALMAQGAPALKVLGSLGRRLGVASAELHYSDDPFGVAYWVASWRLGRA